jgi:hypothetical protein
MRNTRQSVSNSQKPMKHENFKQRKDKNGRLEFRLKIFKPNKWESLLLISRDLCKKILLLRKKTSLKNS